jgi:hypothetical protein
MIRTDSFPVVPRAFAVSLVLLAGVLAACTGPIAVSTRTHAEARLADYAAFRLSVAPGEGADVARDGIPLALLEREAAALIEERGYRVGGDAAGGVALRLTAAPERVVRRTWSADPGYNGYVEREREEGVLTLAAVDEGRKVEVWRGESRVRLPEPGLVVGPSRETVWMDALAELIARMPARARD